MASIRHFLQTVKSSSFFLSEIILKIFIFVLNGITAQP